MYKLYYGKGRADERVKEQWWLLCLYQKEGKQNGQWQKIVLKK